MSSIGHGFGQEMNVRQSVDEKAAGKVGGWKDLALMKRTYTHAEDAGPKVWPLFVQGSYKPKNGPGLSW